MCIRDSLRRPAHGPQGRLGIAAEGDVPGVVPDVGEAPLDVYKRQARRLWVSQSTYSGYETGKIQVPVDTLLKLADIYDVSMDYLMGRTDER